MLKGTASTSSSSPSLSLQLLSELDLAFATRVVRGAQSLGRDLSVGLHDELAAAFNVFLGPLGPLGPLWKLADRHYPAGYRRSRPCMPGWHLAICQGFCRSYEGKAQIRCMHVTIQKFAQHICGDLA